MITYNFRYDLSVSTLNSLEELSLGIPLLESHLWEDLLGSKLFWLGLLLFSWLQISLSLHRKIKIVKLVKNETFSFEENPTYLLYWGH
jgi:hypothetical protein